jgi:hypothetical protein
MSPCQLETPKIAQQFDLGIWGNCQGSWVTSPLHYCPSSLNTRNQNMKFNQWSLISFQHNLGKCEEGAERQLWPSELKLELPKYPSLFQCSLLPFPCTVKTPKELPRMSGKFQGQGETLPSPTFHCLKSASAVPQFFFFGGWWCQSINVSRPVFHQNNDGVEGAGKTIFGIRGGAGSTDKCSSVGYS